jgi:hypothetical protein
MMTKPEAVIAWRLFELTWILLAPVCGVFALSLALTDFSIEPLGIWVLCAVVGTYAGFACYNAKAAHRGNPTIVFMLGAFAQTILITGVMTPITYVASATALPMQDATFYALDQALRLDWRSYFDFVHERPFLIAVFARAYALIGFQILVVPFVLAAAGGFRRLQQYVLALLFTLVASTVISTLLPAMGLYHHLALTPADHPNIVPATYYDYLRDMPALRDGSLRHLNLFSLTGVLTFPSFHAATAVLCAWAVAPVRWVGPIAIAVNVVMFLSTPIGGGHYFVDLIAGTALTVVAIAAARRLCRAVERASAAKGMTATQPAAT